PRPGDQCYLRNAGRSSPLGRCLTGARPLQFCWCPDPGRAAEGWPLIAGASVEAVFGFTNKSASANQCVLLWGWRLPVRKSFKTSLFLTLVWSHRTLNSLDCGADAWPRKPADAARLA